MKYLLEQGMDKDEEKLIALQKKIKFDEDASLLDHLKVYWYLNLLIVRKQRTLNALKWIQFQSNLKKRKEK